MKALLIFATFAFCTLSARSQQAYSLSELISFIEAGDSLFHETFKENLVDAQYYGDDTAVRSWIFTSKSRGFNVKLSYIKNDSAVTHIIYETLAQLAGRVYVKELLSDAKERKFVQNSADTVTDGSLRTFKYRWQSTSHILEIVELEHGDTDMHGRYYRSAKASITYTVILRKRR